MKRLIMTLLVSNFLTLCLVQPLSAQQLSLEECMAYAVEHSTEVGEKQLSLDDTKADYNQSLASLFPAVSGSVSGATNFGRSIDPATNSYTNVTTFSNSYSVSGSLPLFSGLMGINQVRAAKVARQQGVSELELSRDQVAMRTMSAYMDAVYFHEAVAIAREQLAASRRVVEQSRRQYELGLKSAADVAEVESQEASLDYLLTEQENNLSVALITLREVMNYPQDEPLEIVTTFDISAEPVATPLGDVVDYALSYNPRVVASQHQAKHSKLQYSMAKGRAYPSLYLYGGYNTSYFVDFDNRQAYDSFWTQFRNNRGSYIQVNLSIPIFSGLSSKSAKRRAANSWRRAELQHTATLQSVESEVVQTYQQMQGFGKQYVQGDRKVRAAALAYDAAEQKYENGLISALDLQTAANTLLQAKSDRLRARLQYIVKSRMVDYYNGKPLIK